MISIAMSALIVQLVIMFHFNINTSMKQMILELLGISDDEEPDERITATSILRDRSSIMVYGSSQNTKVCSREATIRQFNSVR
jgi:hypothetical protein